MTNVDAWANDIVENLPYGIDTMTSEWDDDFGNTFIAKIEQTADVHIDEGDYLTAPDAWLENEKLLVSATNDDGVDCPRLTQRLVKALNYIGYTAICNL